MLRLEGVSVAYGSVPALWDVSLEVAEGESVALVGANGAGKSTLLRVIMGLIPLRSGRVLFGDRELNGAKPHAVVANGIAYVPEGRRLFPYLTVRQNLLMGAYTRRARGQRDASLQHVYQLFPFLRERATQLAGTLSGGEQQLLSIARALMSQPRLLLLDEPSFGLAPLTVERVFEALSQIRESGIAFLLAEQNVGEALTVAQRGYVLENGRVVLAGASGLLMADSRVKSAYLGL